MKEDCSGNINTEATESNLNSMLESISIAKGKGQISEDNYNEIISQIGIVRESNNRIKCIVDNLPKEIVSTETIMDDIDSKISNEQEE